MALLALLGAVSPALGDVPADAVGAVDALVLGDDPLDPYDDPPPANAFAGAAGLDDEDADMGEDEVEDVKTPKDGVSALKNDPEDAETKDAPEAVADDEDEVDDVDLVADVVDDLDPEDADDLDYAVALDYDDLMVAPAHEKRAGMDQHLRDEEEEEEKDLEEDEADLDADDAEAAPRRGASRRERVSSHHHHHHERVSSHHHEPVSSHHHSHHSHEKEKEEKEEIVKVVDRHARCGPGAKVTVPTYYISGKGAEKAPARVTKEFERAKKLTRVEAFEADDPKRADVIWTFASLGVIPPSSTRVDPDLNAPMHERMGRLRSIGDTVSHLRAVAAAFDAGDETALILEDRTTNDFEMKWPGKSLDEYIASLPEDWKIVNLAAYFAETEDVYEVKYEKDEKTGENTVPVPVLTSQRKEMREWVTAWDEAGRPSAMPRPYRVAPDARLAGIEGGVAAHKGSSAWLVNRDGMREILRAYRRPDGSMHLDAATCTEYDACVISEAFRNVGGIYEATPPLFAEKPGPEQLRRYDTGPDVNDVLETFRDFVGDWLGFIAGEKNGFLEHAEGTARSQMIARDADEDITSETLAAALGRSSSKTEPADSSERTADLSVSRERRVVAAAAIAAGAAADEVTYGFVAEAEPTAEEKAAAELAAKKLKAEAEVKATLEKAKEEAEAATGGIDWKAMRNVDYDEEAFYGTYDRATMKPKEYKYLDESAPMYESIEEAEAAFEAAQKQKEADEKERAAEAAAGREAKTKAEKLAEAGDGHWHSKRGRGGVPLAEALSAKKLDTAVGAIGMRPFRHHIHFDDEPEKTKSSLPADAEKLDTAVGAVGAKPPPRGARKTPAASKKTSTRAAALSGLTSVVDKDGYECSAPASAKAKAKLGAFEDTGFRFDVFDELRAKDELFARRRIAALGAAERVAASAKSARGGLLALGGAAAVAGAFAVTKRARRRVGSDAERVPLIADRV